MKWLGIPELVVADGPHGVLPDKKPNSREVVDARADAGSYLPTGDTLAATWNPQLDYALIPC